MDTQPRLNLLDAAATLQKPVEAQVVVYLKLYTALTGKQEQIADLRTKIATGGDR